MNNEQKALLKTLQRPLLRIRLMGYEGQKSGLPCEQSEMIADLADALHNISEALSNESYDINFHTNIMLGSFDEKYKDKSSIQLLELYQHILENEI
ncbi:hypothetical protein [Pseudoalteromonas maricaloris]|uniref:hypothetical protein n=1 Tax=Pseudoalteromonas maricaloris TaxID=184924 RepID=UPI003C24DC6D